MGALAAGSRLIKELRTWTFAPIGLVLVVVLLAAGVVALIATGGETNDEANVRTYFMSAAGGGAPEEQARRIELSDCRRANGIVQNEFVYQCNVVFADRGFRGCFALDEHPITLGSRQLADLVAGCDRVFWDANAMKLVAPIGP